VTHTLLAVALLAFADDDMKKAEEAFRKQDYKAAREHAAAAAKADPKAVEPRVLLGLACLQLRDHAAAEDAFTEALKLNDKLAFAYDRRGDARLKRGNLEGAVADFDKKLELDPTFAPEHWRRGIALYYVGRFKDGAAQFETHKKANPEDVENAAWHYLCNAKVVGKEKARAGLIGVTKDTRVPMAKIQELFAGKAEPKDVLAAAEILMADTPEGTEARFYAHLYLALWYEAEGDAAKVVEHLTPAVEKYKIGHYMWDVANVHLAKLKKK
jgi:lipoprotein NlpI